MGFKESYVFLCIVLLLALVLEATLATDSIHRRNFPNDFVFGASSSAYQYEGAAFVDGKGESIWDNFTHKHPDKIIGGSNGDEAIDSYHRYKEDVLTLKDIGFKAYRFSISWPRILPKGRRSGGVNWKGIEYYKNLLKELQAKGIEPYITLFHWDVPQALEDEYKGFLDSSIVKDFQDYADLCFDQFGDIVKHWITLNEPWSFSFAGYSNGSCAPGRCSPWRGYNCTGGDSGTEPYIVAHNQILAHAAAVETYRTKYQANQKGYIGITLVTFWYVPYNASSEDDKKATGRLLDFNLGWFLHPLIYGDYPPIMKKLVDKRLPVFTPNQTLSINGSLDFLGLNYYTTNYARDDPTPHPEPAYDTDYQANYTLYNAQGHPIGPMVNGSWIASYPEGFKDLLIYIKDNYTNPIIYITENGYLDYDKFPFQKKIDDNGRVQYYNDHLLYLKKAMKAGVNVKGYFAWSLMDNFEWASGYSVRFGITYIDFKNNLTRLPKLSAKWFTCFLHYENYDITLLDKVNPSSINIADY